MKRYFRIAALLMALALLLALAGCQGGDQRKRAYVNNNLAGIATFAFGTETEGEGVQATGTVFVQAQEHDAVATVTAHLARGESHGEGVSFYVAKGWFVTKVLTDFPHGGDAEEQYQLTSIVRTADAGSEWAYIVEIACDKNMSVPDGAEGDVVIELTWDYKSVAPKSFKMISSVGAGFAGGTQPNGVTAVMTEIPLAD